MWHQHKVGLNERCLGIGYRAHSYVCKSDTCLRKLGWGVVLKNQMYKGSMIGPHAPFLGASILYNQVVCPNASMLVCENIIIDTICIQTQWPHNDCESYLCMVHIWYKIIEWRRQLLHCDSYVLFIVKSVWSNNEEHNIHDIENK